MSFQNLLAVKNLQLSNRFLTASYFNQGGMFLLKMNAVNNLNIQIWQFHQ
jgi:hypothetical protein